MNIESVITIITAILGSGIISLVLQRYWANVDRKRAEEREQSEEARKERSERELNNRMLKKLFRSNLNRTINSVRNQLNDPDITESQLRLYITDLHDDMEDYFEMGGNGATHAAYVQLYHEIARTKPELISIAWLEALSNDLD